MSFISPEFVIFFCVVIPFFFVLPHHRRWIFLLITSYFFYGYGNIQYLPLIIFSTVVDFYAAKQIEATDNQRQRRLWLALSMSVNLAVLFYYKYFNFVGDAVGAVTGVNPFQHDLILPIGISFYTFQSMSYTIDVYRRDLKAEPNLGIMATFVAFFPQLVAGPIERATNLLPQFHTEKRFDVNRTVEGLQLILWGFFKKVVIADRLAIYVNAVYNHVGDYTGLPLILATVFFAFQIYCDFSAYSDIATGTARIIGFDLMQNFRQPYFAQSVREFWARWHISLSTWFRDYLYIPLGGNRVSFVRNLMNLFIVFLVSGLWHGAGWTFVIWGALHGLAIVFTAILRQFHITIFPGKNPVMVLIRVLVTFCFVAFTWIFFRANSLSDAQYIVANLFNFSAVDLSLPLASGLLGAQVEFYLVFALIGILLVVDGLDAKVTIPRLYARMPLLVRWGAYYAIGAAVIFSGLYGEGVVKFIYFQF